MNATAEISDAVSPIRACPHCEQEHGILDRSDTRKTHGLCRRHFHALLITAGLSTAEAWLETDRLSPAGFCPDLGAPLDRAA